MSKVFIFDLDGTLCDVDHRRHFVRTEPKNWDAFNSLCHADQPHHDIVWLFDVLKSQEDSTMILASGRSDEHIIETIDWLKKNDIEYTELFMRKQADKRDDYLVKFDILQQVRAKYGEPYMAIDDRDSVVRGWRKAGVRCLQVQEGNF